MKRINILLVVSVGLIVTVAYAQTQYRRSELEAMSKQELIGIILRLQGGEVSGCSTFDPLSRGTGSILVRYDSPGYGDDGTLKYPNGKLFMLRSSGYGNDFTTYYPNGQVMVLRNLGYGDDRQTYWPNGQVQRLRQIGYGNDGSAFRSDGSNWLLRNLGYADDRQRTGLPVATADTADATVSARLTANDGVISRTSLNGDGWSLEITVNTEDNSISVKECF